MLFDLPVEGGEAEVHNYIEDVDSYSTAWQGSSGRTANAWDAVRNGWRDRWDDGYALPANGVNAYDYWREDANGRFLDSYDDYEWCSQNGCYMPKSEVG